MRSPGRRRGISNARAAFSRNFDANSDVLGQPGDDELVEFVGVGEEEFGRDVVERFGQTQDDAVVAPQHLHRQVGAGEPFLDRERPRRVHARTERREDADPPVADLVGEAFDDDRCGRRGSTPVASPCSARYCRRFDGRSCVESRSRSRASACAAGSACTSRASLPERAPEFERTARAVAAPERRLRGFTGRGRDDDAVDGDLFDAPRRRAEHEALTDPALVDHLFVEFADAYAVGQEHAEQAAVGDRAAALHRDSLRALAARTLPSTRSHTMRGRSPLNRSEG